MLSGNLNSKGSFNEKMRHCEINFVAVEKMWYELIWSILSQKTFFGHEEESLEIGKLDKSIFLVCFF